MSPKCIVCWSIPRFGVVLGCRKSVPDWQIASDPAPKEFLFDTDQVRVRRHGSTLILEPISRDWAWLDEIAGPFDPDFVAATEEDVPAQSRPELELALS
jgi:antitoxin VapB